MSRVAVAAGRGGMGRDRVEDDGDGRKGNDGHDGPGRLLLAKLWGGGVASTPTSYPWRSQACQIIKHIFTPNSYKKNENRFPLPSSSNNDWLPWPNG